MIRITVLLYVRLFVSADSFSSNCSRLGRVCFPKKNLWGLPMQNFSTKIFFRPDALTVTKLNSVKALKKFILILGVVIVVVVLAVVSQSS